MNEGYFGDADLEWIPKLWDIEHFKGDADPEIASYYSGFGWEALDVPTDCPKVRSRMTELKVRFDERYANRRLNGETMEYWQLRLQNRFDEVVRRYERAYSLYENNRNIMDDVTPGLKTTYDRNDAAGGKDIRNSSSSTTSHGKDKMSNTPDSRINESDDYAGAITLSDGSSTGSNEASTSYGRTLKTQGSQSMVRTGSEVITSANSSIDAYRDLDTRFIGEFENNFLNILWY